jgi:LPS O-antigen subunit length determinant protein (WzzB/FepE family)
MDRYPLDELSLRDFYLILRKSRNTILITAIGLGLLTLLLSLALPKTYISKVIVGLGFSPQQNALLANLPSPTGLAQGFGDLLETSVLTQQLELPRPSQTYKSKFDEKKTLWTLSAKGKTREQAQQNAERILQVAKEYLTDRLTQGVTLNANSSLAQTQLDLRGAQESLRRVQEELKKLAQSTPASSGTTAAGLEARGIDPQIARTANPALTSLSLDESRLRSSVAQTQARVQTLTQLIENPAEISRLVGQALNVQVLVPPAQPLRASFPRPLLFTVIAGVLGLLLGIFWAFVSEAIRPRPEPEPRQEARLEARERVG